MMIDVATGIVFIVIVIAVGFAVRKDVKALPLEERKKRIAIYVAILIATFGVWELIDANKLTIIQSARQAYGLPPVIIVDYDLPVEELYGVKGGRVIYPVDNATGWDKINVTGNGSIFNK